MSQVDPIEKRIGSAEPGKIITDLLAALEAVEKWAWRVSDELLDGEGNREKYANDMDAARAAIQKARGEAE